METAAEAKAKRGPKATIRRQLTRVHTPATSLSKTPHITSLPVEFHWQYHSQLQSLQSSLLSRHSSRVTMSNAFLQPCAFPGLHRHSCACSAYQTT